ncbi:MAG: peptidoglycan editing factor PgeF [Alphaproteobacteria bacterium]|nr:peptidoglycan editing factor PgeF [Alphaproteobacteria bacterium]
MSWYAANLNKSKHCFFDAKGGVSQGKYAALNTNLSSRDNPADIMHNFEIIAAHFNKQPADMVTLRQGVSDNAVYIDTPTWFKIYADGVVTHNPHLLLGIKTADCAPVLLADYKHGIVGAAHAGWRGAYKGIIENVVRLMLEHGAKLPDISAAVGPCMQQTSFAVQDDMRQILLNLSADNARWFLSDADGVHFYFDLSGYVESRLKNAGVENIENSRIDTYPEQNGYFSYRRNTHLGLINVPKDYPTQYSCICL